MTVASIAIIGAGNLGRALMGGLINHHYPPNKIWATHPTEDKLFSLREQFKVHTTTDNREAAAKADLLILTVKPNIVPLIAKELADIVVARRLLVITTAAGVGTSALAFWLGDNVPIVRCMPNVASLIGLGATALYANPHVTTDERHLVEALMKSIGASVWLTDEKLMNPVTALSGCGPAYFFLLIEALEQAGVQLGLPLETARSLVLQTALGAARLAIESGKNATALINEVASKGGSTVEALRVLKDNNFHDLMLSALKAASARAEERENDFEKNLGK